MNEIALKERVPKFLLHFFLTNAFWLIPAIVLCMHHGTSLLILVSLLLTYGYASWCQYTKTTFFGLTIKPAYILWGYTVCVSGFIFLTGYSTYQGIVGAYGISGFDKKMVCFLIALIVALTLLTLTLMIKVRRAPDTVAGLIFCYILFDALTGLPANFLFFYENAQNGSEIKFNKERLPLMVAKCQSSILTMQGSTHQALVQHRKQDSALQKARSVYDQSMKSLADELHDDTTRVGRSRRAKALDARISQSPTILPADTALTAANINDSLCTVWLASLEIAAETSRRLQTVNDASLSRPMADSVRDRLRPVIFQSKLPELQSLNDSLRTKQPNSIETLKLLYRFLGSRFSGNDDSIIKTEGYDKDTEENIWMSLSTSIIIDILPLLFSLLYVKYKFND